MRALIRPPGGPAANRASQPPAQGPTQPPSPTVADRLTRGGGVFSLVALLIRDFWKQLQSIIQTCSSQTVVAQTKIVLCRRKELGNIIQPNCSQSRKGHLTNSPFLRIRAGLLFKIFFTQVARSCKSKFLGIGFLTQVGGLLCLCLP